MQHHPDPTAPGRGRLVRAVGLLLGGLVLALAPAGTLLPQAAASPAGLDVSHTRAFTQAAMETQVLALTNKQRRRHGCRPLAMSSPLRRAARAHTVEMALRGTMSHQFAGEPRFTVRIERAGYRNWRRVAENVARGYGSPAGVVRAWMNSAGHRRNILDCRLRDLGVGVVRMDGTLWWTQDFGRR